MITGIVDAAPARPALAVIDSPSHDEIAGRAFDLFLARGGSCGRDVDDWLQAERELLHERTRQLAAVILIEPDPWRPLGEPAWP